MSITHALRAVLVSLPIAAAATACGGAGSSSAARATAPTASSDPSCPVAVAGTSVTVEDTDSGAALVFVTTGDATEVRRRVEAMAKMHNDHHGAMGALPDGGGAQGHDMAGHAGHDMSGKGSVSGHAGHGGGDPGAGAHAGHAGGMITVHSKASVEDGTGAAKLVLTAAPADVARLQTELRAHAKHLATGSCAMGH